MTRFGPDEGTNFKECVIGSDHCETRIPREAVLKELERCRFDQECRFAIKLALEEALANAVKHGNKEDTSKHIVVRYDINDERAIIIVRDEGEGFIPEDIPDPTTPDRLSQPSGRGIMLISAYMDEVCYCDQGREVRFIKRRKK